MSHLRFIKYAEQEIAKCIKDIDQINKRKEELLNQWLTEYKDEPQEPYQNKKNYHQLEKKLTEIVKEHINKLGLQRHASKQNNHQIALNQLSSDHQKQREEISKGKNKQNDKKSKVIPSVKKMIKYFTACKKELDTNKYNRIGIANQNISTISKGAKSLGDRN